MIAGNVVGAFGLGSYGVLLFSRILEGCGFAMCSVAGIVLINMWYPNKNTGLFVGIFVMFAAIASVLSLNLALPLSESFGLASVWWITAAMSAIFTVLFVLFVKEAPAPAAADGGPAVPEAKPQLASVLKNGAVIAICVA